MYYIAVIWWVKVETGSDAAVAVIALCATVPAIVCGPFAGAIVDRLDRRHLMIAMDLVRLLITLTTGLLLAGGLLRTWHLCIAAALLAASSIVFGPALAASIPRLVPSELLATANSMNQTGVAVGGLLGPALGGLLVAGAGSVSAILINTASFGASAVLLWSSTFPAVTDRIGQPQHGLLRETLEGINYFRSRPLLWGMTLQVVLLNFCRAPIIVLIPGLAYDVFRTDATGFGLLEAMTPAGFVLGGLLLSLLRLRAVGRSIIWLLVGWGAATAAIGWSTGFALTAALLALSGVALSMTVILGTTVFNTRIPQDMQGRAFGSFNALSAAMQPLSLAVVAPAVVVVGVGPLFVIAGLIVAVAGFAGYLVPGLPGLRSHSPLDDGGTGPPEWQAGADARLRGEVP